MTYEDLIDKQVWARLDDQPQHDEWELCKVISIVHSGMKVQCNKKKETFLIPNNAVMHDVRLRSAFVPYESEAHSYDGMSQIIHTQHCLLMLNGSGLIIHMRARVLVGLPCCCVWFVRFLTNRKFTYFLFVKN